ncbi:aldo/keto reductase [Streptomyces mirabilis]|uniref:aldo/keto reductase n=1 Tax=Streptomyces mirabilis TaxID=68239 RepID=UPI0036DB64DC
METLNGLVTSGKVRYLGVSNFSGWQLMKSLWVADANGYQPFVSNQIYYSLESRDAEYELIPASVDQGLGVLVWSPLAGGLVSGKYRRDQQPENGRHLTEWSEPPVRDEDKLYDTVDVLVEVASVRGVSPAQVALAYLLAKPGVTSVIVGARRDEQLADNLGAADVHLTREDLDRLDKVRRGGPGAAPAGPLSSGCRTVSPHGGHREHPARRTPPAHARRTAPGRPPRLRRVSTACASGSSSCSRRRRAGSVRSRPENLRTRTLRPARRPNSQRSGRHAPSGGSPRCDRGHARWGLVRLAT